MLLENKETIISFLQNLFQLLTSKLYFISKLTWILLSVRQDKKLSVPKANFKVWDWGSILCFLLTRHESVFSN